MNSPITFCREFTQNRIDSRVLPLLIISTYFGITFNMDVLMISSDRSGYAPVWSTFPPPLGQTPPGNINYYIDYV